MVISAGLTSASTLCSISAYCNSTLIHFKSFRCCKKEWKVYSCILSGLSWVREWPMISGSEFLGNMREDSGAFIWLITPSFSHLWCGWMVFIMQKRSTCMKVGHSCATNQEANGLTYYQQYEHNGIPCFDGIFRLGNLDKVGDFRLAKIKEN